MTATHQRLNQWILAGTALGIVLGLGLHQVGTDGSFAQGFLITCQILGRIFVGVLKMILAPLVFVSIALGICRLQSQGPLNRIWRTTLLFFIATTSLAAITGLIAVNLVKPGKGLSIDLLQQAVPPGNAAQLNFHEFTKNFIDALFLNPIAAMAKGELLALVVFAVFLGIALLSRPKHSDKIKHFLQESFDVIMWMVHIIMHLAPVGIAALLTRLLATQNLQLLQQLSLFIFTVVGVLFFHGAITLPVFLAVFAKRHPFKFFNDIKPALITAFSTSSSSATMPITMECVEKNLKVDKSIAGFVLPLGATMNMDGTALYEAIAAIFIANVCGIELSILQQILVVIMSVMASIGAPGIPSAGMVTMLMVLQSVGLPTEAIAILLPIDRFLDAFRTTVNVEGDAICSCVVQKQLTN